MNAVPMKPTKRRKGVQIDSRRLRDSWLRKVQVCQGAVLYFAKSIRPNPTISGPVLLPLSLHWGRSRVMLATQAVMGEV